MSKSLRLFVCIFVFVTLSVSAAAATRTWGGSSGNWSNPANWVGGVAPVAGDDLVFPVGPYTMTNDFAAGTPFESLTFLHGPTASVTLNGNAIVLGAGGLGVHQHVTIDVPITLGDDQTWQVAYSLLIQKPTDINGRTLTIDNDASVRWWYSGHAGSGQVIVNGGYLELGASSGTSTLTLNGVFATIHGIGDNSAPHPGLIVVNGGSPAHPRRGLVVACDTNAPVTINGDTFMPDDFFFGPPCEVVPTRDLAMGPAATYGGFPLRVTGTVALGGATLRFANESTDVPRPGRSVTLIDNDGVDPISGTFNGLPEGAMLRDGSRYFVITYHGGTGNDVVIYQVVPPTTNFVVTNLNDSGPGSLRQAILDANATLGYDTVTFAPGLSGTIILTGGELAITEDVNVIGPASGGITVSGNNASRIFAIDTDMAQLANLTMTAGRSAEGGAVHARIASLDLQNVTFTNNTALTGSGGALYVTQRPPFGRHVALRMFDATFTGNSAPNGDGGAVRVVEFTRIEADRLVMTGNSAGGSGGAWDGGSHPASVGGTGLLQFRNATISNNRSCLQPQATACGGGGLRIGGFNNFQQWSILDISRSTISGNVATPANSGLGGGIYQPGPGRIEFVMDHSTLSGNQANEGGGLFAESTYAVVHDSTVVNNQAVGVGGGIFMRGGLVVSMTIAANSAGGDGGGLYIGEPNAIYRFASNHIINSIIADNQSPSATPDVAVVPTDTVTATYSLIRTPGTSTVVLSTGTITGQDPLLGPLQTDPYSPTATRSPLPGSPAIDSGNPAITPTSATDQRTYPRVANGRIDMGAVEVQPTPPAADLAVTSPGRTFVAGQPDSYTITVTNHGTATARDVVVTDGPLPGAHFTTTSSQGTCSNFAVTCNLGDLAPLASATITVNLTYVNANTRVRTVTATTPTADSNRSNDSVTRTFTVTSPTPVIPRHDLRMTGSAAQQGSNLVYTFVVTNEGPDAAPDVVFTDPIPAGTSFVSASTTTGSCTNANGEVTCALGTLADNATATITITLAMQTSGNITNTATVSSPANAGLGETAFSNNVSTVVFESHDETAHIPTLGEWMQILLAGLLGLAACVILKARS